jgi:adenine-specific DNA-methyltransferase
VSTRHLRVADPNDLDPVALARRVAELEAELRARPRFGLVFEEQPEDVVTQCTDKLPVLTQLPSRRVVSPAGPGAGAAHLLIEGDNYHALTALQYTHAGAVDVIYIDPPYNTGNKDFRYNDRLIDKDDAWRHSAWLSFMNRRLRLARTLLKDTGVILISIDDNEQAHLRLLCDQVFGERNFVGVLIWQKKYGGGNDSSQLVTEHEYVLAYSRHRSHVAPFLVPHGEKYLTRYRHADERGRYFWDTLARPGLRGAITVTVSDEFGSVTVKCGISQAKADTLLALGDIRIVRRSGGEPSVQFKQRLATGKRMRSIVQKATSEVGGTSEGKEDLEAVLSTSFSYPKPVALLKHLLAPFGAAAVVLDFFAGSGTTGHAVAHLNAADGGSRQAILVTNNENDICTDVTLPRMRAVLTGQWADGKDHDPLPGELRYYRTSFVQGSRHPDTFRARLAAGATDLIAVRENTHDRTDVSPGRAAVLTGPGKVVAVWAAPDTTGLEDLHTAAVAAADEGVERVLYAYTPDAGDPDLTGTGPWDGWRIEPIPAHILAALRAR